MFKALHVDAIWFTIGNFTDLPTYTNFYFGLISTIYKNDCIEHINRFLKCNPRANVYQAILGYYYPNKNWNKNKSFIHYFSNVLQHINYDEFLNYQSIIHIVMNHQNEQLRLLNLVKNNFLNVNPFYKKDTNNIILFYNNWLKLCNVNNKTHELMLIKQCIIFCNNNYSNTLNKYIHINNKTLDWLKKCIFIAINNNCLDITKICLFSGIGINDNISDITNDYETPIYVACKKKHIKMIEFLCQFPKCNVNFIPKHSKNSILNTACELQNKKIIKTLLKKNACVHFENKFGETPLMHLFTTFTNYNNNVYNLLEIAKMLLNKGSNINCVDTFGNSILLKLLQKTLSFKTKKNIFEFLLTHDIDINIANKRNENALMYACDCNNVYFAQRLLHKVICINTKDNLGRTALTRSKNQKIYKLLYMNGAI